MTPEERKDLNKKISMSKQLRSSSSGKKLREEFAHAIVNHMKNPPNWGGLMVKYES